MEQQREITWEDIIPETERKLILDELDSTGIKYFPERSKVFRAFELTPFKDVKVVIMGQDPYKDDLADGLAFSRKGKVDKRRSLARILNQIYPKKDYPHNGDLEKWAKQGVLLINSALTVPKSGANHLSKWNGLISNVINKLIEGNSDVLFLFLGTKPIELLEQVKLDIPDNSLYGNRYFLFCHPMARKHNYGRINKPNENGMYIFDEINQILKDLGKKEINWKLEEK